jgi:chromosome segregation ATPase
MDADGVQWLSDCIFAGTCIVDVPAYGPNRTRILAIAEKLNEVHNQMPQVKAEDLSDTRNDLNEVQDLLFKMWEGLDTLYTKTFEIEQATVETDIGKLAASFAERIAKIADHIASLSEKHGLVVAEQEKLQNDLTTAIAERDTLQQEKETAERNTLVVKRKSRLAEVGIDIADEETEKLQRYLSMSEDVFSALIADFSTARKPAVAEKKDIVIPEPLGTTREFKSMKELAAALKKL